MLMCHIINYLQKEGHRLLYYFCQATRKTTAIDVVRGLLWMLLTQDRSLIGPLRQDYEQKGKMLFQDSNSLGVLGAMLTGILSNNRDAKIAIVIDALDECDTGLDHLLHLLVQLSKSTRTVVSSRNWPNIANGLSVAREKLHIVLERNDDKVSGAVGVYIRRKVDQLATLKGYDQKTYNEVSTYLRHWANGTFLWVSLVCQQLADNEVSAADTYGILRSYPKDLDELYRRIMAQISRLRPERRYLCFKMLSLLCSCCYPIDLSGLAFILEAGLSLEQITKECRGLLVFQSSAVYFVHQSAKEFLLRESPKTNVFGGAGYQHTWVLTRLIHAMSTSLGRNMMDTFRAGTPMALLQYACVYWIDHFIKSDPNRQEQQVIVYSFLEKHFLHWVETLSRLQFLFKGIDGLLALWKACKVRIVHL